MFKRIALLGLITLTNASFADPQKQDQKIIAWDIHKVLCTEPNGRGYECHPKEDTLKLVQELHGKRIKQVLLSNISTESFFILFRKYPELFAYFDMDHSLTQAEGIFTRKPHRKYYKKFLKKNPGIRPENIIFFDDKPVNVQGARKEKIDGQLFCNADQARTILVRKGYLTEYTSDL